MAVFFTCDLRLMLSGIISLFEKYKAECFCGMTQYAKKKYLSNNIGIPHTTIGIFFPAAARGSFHKFCDVSMLSGVIAEGAKYVSPACRATTPEPLCKYLRPSQTHWRFGLRREVKRHAAFVREKTFRTFRSLLYARKRCRGSALPPHSKICASPFVSIRAIRV